MARMEKLRLARKRFKSLVRDQSTMNITKHKIISTTARCCHFLIGVVFLLAAFSKIGDLEGFLNIIRTINFFPPLFKDFVVLIIPGLELMLGIYLLLRLSPQQSAIIATFLLLTFTALETYLARHGTISSCGCIKLTFAKWLMATGWWAVIRDFSLTLLSIAGLWESGVFRRVSEVYNIYRLPKKII